MKRADGHRGFTLVELLVVVTIIAVLASLLAPAVFGVIQMAHQTACASNLRQLGAAMQLYLKDNQGFFFPIRGPDNPATPLDEGKLWYFGYETGTSWQATAEGARVLDKTRARLYPYTGDYDGIEICPSFNYYGSFKAKFRGKWWTYGVNKVLCPDLYASSSLSPRNLTEIRGPDLARTVVMADAAQVNTYQPPASRSNPLVEEWHYVQPSNAKFQDWPHVHFRHGGRANTLFADGHIEALEPDPRSLDARLPSAMVGHFDPNQVLYEPRPGR